MANITRHNQEGKETIEFGQGFSETQIRNFCKFYLTFSGLQIQQTMPAEFNHLEHFLMEMGKGYALVDRQMHIHTEDNDYYIDLVFYNYLLKCFVLVDLKTTKVSYEDVGQMDMYLKLFDTYKRPEGDNPTIGIILCSETNADVARFSTLATNKQMYASKYLTYMPSKEVLAREIEQQKEIFRLQNNEEEEE